MTTKSLRWPRSRGFGRGRDALGRFDGRSVLGDLFPDLRVDDDQTESFSTQLKGDPVLDRVRSSSWSGSTMYKRSKRVSAPVSSTSTVNFEAANRRIYLQGREYVSTLTTAITAGGSTSAFATSSDLLRPTDARLFSWLAGIAEKFEEFKFSRLQFVYEPQCSTTTTGSVALWYDGDPTHVAPATWNSVVNTGANVHGAPWAKHVFPIPHHLFGSRKTYFTRNEFDDVAAQATSTMSFATPQDPLEYFPGIYGFASVDVLASATGTQALGKIYLDYAVTFQTQNVDSWSETSMVSHSQLSCEPAKNSGTGLFIQAGSDIPTTGTALAKDCTTNGCSLLGYAGYATVAPTSTCPALQGLTSTGAVVAGGGNRYFNIGPSNVYSVVHDVELALDIGVSLANNDAVGTNIQICPAGLDATDAAKWLTCTSTTDKGNAVAGRILPVYQFGVSTGAGKIPPTLVGCKQFVQKYQLRLNAGDRFAYTVSGGSTVSGFTCRFSPTVFGIHS
jgi:hypothetical protein